MIFVAEHCSRFFSSFVFLADLKCMNYLLVITITFSTLGVLYFALAIVV